MFLHLFCVAASLQEVDSLDSGGNDSDSLTDRATTDPLLDTVLDLRGGSIDEQEDRGEFVLDMEPFQHDPSSSSSASPRPRKKGRRVRLSRPAVSPPLSPSMLMPSVERTAGRLPSSHREQDLQQLGAVAEQQELMVQLEGQEQAGMLAEDAHIVAERSTAAATDLEDGAEQADDEAASADSGISDFEVLSGAGPDGLSEERLLYANGTIMCCAKSCTS